MHENGVASYTTAKGNVIYDMETGGLCAYPAPYRYASVSTSDDGQVTLSLQSVSVKQAAMNQKLDAPNGSFADTDKVDVQEYMKNAMYGDVGDDGDSIIMRLVMRYAARYLDRLTDIPGALETIAGIDLNDLLFNSLLPSVLGGSGTDLDLGGSVGAINISYSVDPNDPDGSGVHLNPTSGAASPLGGFSLVLDEEAHAWKLAEGENAAYAFDITCLTLRPAELVKYTGGEAGDQNHFPDARVVDGQGNVYTLDQLDALLDEGEAARVAYFEADGNEISDDRESGVYTARIVIESAGTTTFAADASAGDSVNVNVGDADYRFALEPSTLTVRSVSDATDAESGALGVELLDSDADASSIADAVAAAKGGVAAQLPAGTKVYVNDREAAELTGDDLSGVRLFSDELLSAAESGDVDRLQALKDRAANLGFEIGDNADFQYLDLVDAAQSNLWVSSSAGATVYWKVPEGADPASIKVLHFKDLHREYGVDAAELQNQIDACTVEEMQLDTTHAADGYVSFQVDRAGFSPFVMTWADQGGSEPSPDPNPDHTPDPPTRRPTVTVEPAQGGTAEVSDRYAAKGDTVTISTKPAEGGVVDRIIVTDAQGKTVHVHYSGVNAYWFEMPADEATVTVTYREPTPHTPFADVAEGAWYDSTVDRITALGFMSGYADGMTFGPDDQVNRAMMAAVIYNICGRPSVDEGVVATFADVDQNAYYAEALAWCEAEGAVEGYGDGIYYGPLDPISREQLAVMLLRISGDQDTSGTRIDAYADASQVSAFAEEGMRWAVEQGIINGFQPENLLRPTSMASRAEVAAMVLNWWDNVATK